MSEIVSHPTTCALSLPVACILECWLRLRTASRRLMCGTGCITYSHIGSSARRRLQACRRAEPDKVPLRPPAWGFTPSRARSGSVGSGLSFVLSRSRSLSHISLAHLALALGRRATWCWPRGSTHKPCWTHHFRGFFAGSSWRRGSPRWLQGRMESRLRERSRLAPAPSCPGPGA